MLEQLGNFMETVNRLQQSFSHIQDQLSDERITVAGGGEVFKVTVNGQQAIVSLEIADDFFSHGDRQILQNLMVATINDALAKSRELHQNSMKQLLTGLNLPKIPGIL